MVGALMYKKEDGPDWFSHFRRYLSLPEDWFIVESNKKKKKSSYPAANIVILEKRTVLGVNKMGGKQ